MAPGYVPADAIVSCGENSFSASKKPVNTFMITGVTLPAQQFEQLLKTIPRVALC